MSLPRSLRVVAVAAASSVLDGTTTGGGTGPAASPAPVVAFLLRSGNRGSAKGSASTSTSSDVKRTEQCVFDDVLFGLRLEDKQQLLQEVQQMEADVDYVRSGGSRVCGVYNQPCSCPDGWVVFGVPHLGLWGPAVHAPASLTGGSVVCGSGGMLAGPGTPSVDLASQIAPFAQLAECHCYGQNPKRKHLAKALNSVSLLQEAWVFLLRLLERRKLMPLGTRSQLAGTGLENWSKRSTEVGSIPRVPEHYFINRYMVALKNMPQLFLQVMTNGAAEAGNASPPGAGMMAAEQNRRGEGDHATRNYIDHAGPPVKGRSREPTATAAAEKSGSSEDIELLKDPFGHATSNTSMLQRGNDHEVGGNKLHKQKQKQLRCGEWAELNYANMFQDVCAETIAFRYEPTLHGVPPHLDLASSTLYGDVVDYPRLLSPAHFLDLIISTQVFEHLPHPEEAAVSLFNSLRPGGLVLLSVPQLAQYHQVPGDFFRYTKEGLYLLLTEAGFCVPKTLMASGGDYVWDIARSAGLQTSEFTMQEIDNAFRWGFDAIADGASTIFAVALKPPHPHPECRQFR